MRNLPVYMGGYKLTVVEAPTRKMREDDDGNVLPVTDRDGVSKFVVSLFAKLVVEQGQRAPKGEEIKVTLTSDPGPGIREDMRVELIDARVSPWEREHKGRYSSGISFEASGLKPWGGDGPVPLPVSREE